MRKITLRERFFFWLFCKICAFKAHGNKQAEFGWHCRRDLIYRPIFEARGLQAVHDEHRRFVALMKRVTRRRGKIHNEKYSN